MGYYSEDEIPTLVDLVDEFTTFNYWHSCVPGVSASSTLQSIQSNTQPAYQPQPSLCRRRYP
jgi:phospholipase C